MEVWKKGAIIGGLWGLLSTIPYSYINAFDHFTKKFLLTLIGLPAFIALIMNFHFSFIFFGGLMLKKEQYLKN